MAGPSWGSQLPKGHITAVWEPARYTAETLSRLITRLVCTLVSKYQVSTQKLCLRNGNSKSVLVRALSVCGSSSLFSKCLELTWPSG